MAKLDSKKIDSTLKSITGVLTTAVKTLNEMTDGEFKGSTLESDPLSCARQIIQTFLTAQARVADQSQYDGKSVDEITEMQEAARQAELADIQERYNQKLAKRNEKPEPEAGSESTGEEIPQT